MLDLVSNKMNYLIRSSDVDESDKIVELLRRSIFEICGPDYGDDESILNNWVENKTIKNIKSWIENEQSLSLSYLEEEKVVGFCLSNIKGEILLLYVLPEATGKGVGTKLYQSMEDSLASLGIERLVAYSTITAKSFYLKMGFKQFNKAIKVGSYDGEFPLEKHIVR